MRSFAPARFNRVKGKAGHSGSTAIRSFVDFHVRQHRTNHTQLPLHPIRCSLRGAPATGDSPNLLLPLDQRIQRHEAAARSQFFNMMAALDAGEAAGWFTRLIDDRLLPSLKSIGFDKELTTSLLTMAAPAWENMGRYPSSGLRIDPCLARKIAEIRACSRSGYRRQSEKRGLLDAMNSSALLSLAARSADPANLHTLIENIPASWLILPRAHRTLALKDSRCLPFYLSCLNDEPDPGFKKLLVRVVIDYIANFTHKYHRSTLSDEETATSLIFGYAAMFWKNLRQPPTGYQNEFICAHFFRRAQRVFRSLVLPGPEVQETIGRMASVIRRIFPQPDAFGRIPAEIRYQPQLSMLALRHGETGIASVLLFLGPSAGLYKNSTAGRIPYHRVPACLVSLIRIINSCWQAESPATCNNVRRFLVRLADRYRFARQEAGAIHSSPAQVLRFSAPRTIALIDSFTASLAKMPR